MTTKAMPVKKAKKVTETPVQPPVKVVVRPNRGGEPGAPKWATRLVTEPGNAAKAINELHMEFLEWGRSDGYETSLGCGIVAIGVENRQIPPSVEFQQIWFHWDRFYTVSDRRFAYDSNKFTPRFVRFCPDGSVYGAK